MQSLHHKTKGMVIRMKFSAKTCKAAVGALLLAALTLMSVACTGDGMNVEDGTVEEGTSTSTSVADGMNK